MVYILNKKGKPLMQQLVAGMLENYWIARKLLLLAVILYYQTEI